MLRKILGILLTVHFVASISAGQDARLGTTVLLFIRPSPLAQEALAAVHRGTKLLHTVKGYLLLSSRYQL
jgi:hypothetical protein